MTPQKRKGHSARQLLIIINFSTQTFKSDGPFKPQMVVLLDCFMHDFFNENWKIKIKKKLNPYSFTYCNLTIKGHKDRANEAFHNRLNHRT